MEQTVNVSFIFHDDKKVGVFLQVYIIQIYCANPFKTGIICCTMTNSGLELQKMKASSNRVALKWYWPIN